MWDGPGGTIIRWPIHVWACYVKHAVTGLTSVGISRCGDTMKVGFIGLGTMGGHMAYNALNGGNALVVHDINQAAAASQLEAGAAWVDSP